MRFQLVVAFLIGFVGLASCENPCDKALKKAQKCWKIKNPKKEPNNADPPIFLQVCKLEEKKFAKCLKIKDCDEYAKCISQAAADPRAVEMLKQTTPPEPGMTPAEPTPPAADMPADMPAEPIPPAADMPADMPTVPSMQ